MSDTDKQKNHKKNKKEIEGDLHEQEKKSQAVEQGDKDTAQDTGAGEETEAQKIERERKEYLEGWQRAQAELINLKRRHEEERKIFTTLGKETLLRELIPMLDNFNAAFSNTIMWESVDENWRRGIEYIHSQFIETLENNGVKLYGAVGDSFDPELHEVLESAPEGDTVEEVVHQGYKIGDKVIRPAKVKLA
ncbi:MAG: nucleotide exchange factor GrpE [Patescibacteria group bacterium]